MGEQKLTSYQAWGDLRTLTEYGLSETQRINDSDITDEKKVLEIAVLLADLDNACPYLEQGV